jgi:zinc transporter
MNKSPVLFSYSFDENGSGLKVSNGNAAKELANEGLSWVHLDVENLKTKKWLEKEVGYLDHLIIDALTMEETRPRVTEFDNGLLIILRAVNLNANSEPDDMVSLRLWIDKERVITLQRRPTKAVEDVCRNIESGKKIKSSGELLYNLLYQILTITSPFLYALSDKLDALEEKIMHNHDVAFREEILNIRTQTASFKRYLGPQREAIARLRVCDYEWISDWARRHFQEHLDQITLMLEELEESKDRAQILHDELFHGLSEKLNKSMYSLSLVASLFIPLTFFTSIFSVNIAGLPGTENSSAFFWMMSAMMIMVAVQVFLFKRSKLF